MDSITHALLVAALLTATGENAFIIFGIVGAVILDTDILFSFLSRNNPSRYIWIHGGAAHSIPGACFMACIAYIALYFIVNVTSLLFSVSLPLSFGALALFCTILGALVHVSLDYLATPGIPLFWPLSERKYTAGIFAGPSIVMIVVSWTYLIWYIMGGLPLSSIGYYSLIFLAYLSFSILVRIIAAFRAGEKTWPTFNPFRWMVIIEDGTNYTVGFINIFRGHLSYIKNYQKYSGINPGELELYDTLPEVRRVRYHSYFTIAERKDTIITIKDPLREDGTIRYPPYYVKVEIRAK